MFRRAQSSRSTTAYKPTIKAPANAPRYKSAWLIGEQKAPTIRHHCVRPRYPFGIELQAYEYWEDGGRAGLLTVATTSASLNLGAMAKRE